MKKIIVPFLIISCICLKLNAQWGGGVGINLSTSSNNEPNEYSVGYQAFIFKNISLKNNFHLKPQFIFSNERLSKTIKGNGGFENRVAGSQLEIHQNAFYATLPVTLLYMLRLDRN